MGSYLNISLIFSYHITWQAIFEFIAFVIFYFNCTLRVITIRDTCRYGYDLKKTTPTNPASPDVHINRRHPLVEATTPAHESIWINNLIVSPFIVQSLNAFGLRPHAARVLSRFLLFSKSNSVITTPYHALVRTPVKTCVHFLFSHNFSVFTELYNKSVYSNRPIM